VIYNAERLRLKESDRLKTVCETLKRLGADVTETDGGLIINGRKTLRGGEVQSFGDHRIVMMAAAASAVCENPVIISGAEAVNKSYPTFFKDFTVLGGEVIILGD
jgi:3-phosphoshikimate 1-carboxyvinyltransferase